MTMGHGIESQKFVPAFFVDIVEMGTVFEPGEWPHHITMFPPVEETYRCEYGEQLRHAVNPMAPFDVVVGKSALYGAIGNFVELFYPPSVHRDTN